MTNTPPPTQPPPPSGGVNIDGGTVSAGRDIAGRDIVNVSSGISSRMVIALVSVVGVIVFFATACSLVTGIIIGGATFGAFNKPVGSSAAAADSMGAKFRALDSLRPGQPFRLSFTEDEISSYVRFVVGPQLGLNDARVRLLDEPGKLAVRAQYSPFNNLPVIAVFQLRSGDKPFELESAAVQILPLGDSFGWVIVTPFAKSLENQVNSLFSTARFTQVQIDPSPRGWTVTGTAK